jgi:hypothetical protein
MDIYLYYLTGRHVAEAAIFDGVFKTYAISSNLILSGNIQDFILGILMMIGVTHLIVRGVWKLLGKVIMRSVLDRVL